MNMKKAHALFVSGISLLLVLTLMTAAVPTARAAGSCGSLETGYVNGQTVCINITQIITDPSAQQMAQAKPLYVAAYFPLPAGCDTSTQSGCGPDTLPSGYQPLCNPCFHGGGLDSFPYHDHVIAGGFGHHGPQSGDLRELVLVAYNQTYSNQPSFHPFKSAAGITIGEHTGVFQVINAGAANPYEIDTGVLVIFQIQPPS